jgi:glycosyltransferase involved in cell wall biosynthesis
VCKHLGLPGVTTLHGRLDNPELVTLYRRVRQMPLVSISDAQRAPLPFVSWAGTVYHGLPRDLLAYSERGGSYLAFLGRISPEKGPDRAIRIARRAGIPLRIAAKVDKADRAYYEERIRPLLQEPGVEYVGEIGEREKSLLLGDAAALLFPIDWPEPFGIVMIEAMACGTPIIAYRCGSVPEVMRDGETGFIVNDEDGAVAALQKLDQIERAACRRAFEERYTSRRMALDYLRIYRRLRRPAMLLASAAAAADEATYDGALYPPRLTPAGDATMAGTLTKPAR